MWLRWLFTHLLSFDLILTNLEDSPYAYNNTSNGLFKIVLVGVKGDRFLQASHPVIQNLNDIRNEFSMLPIHNSCLITSSFEGIGRDGLIQSITSISESILSSGSNYVPIMIKKVEQPLQKQRLQQLIISQETLFESMKLPKVRSKISS